MPESFGPEARLSGKTDFRRVFDSGRKMVGRSVILWSFDSRDSRPARLGLSVSSKVGSAVRRNRLKRLAREAFRRERDRIAAGHDLVVYFRRGCRWVVLADARAELSELWTRAGLIRQ